MTLTDNDGSLRSNQSATDERLTSVDEVQVLQEPTLILQLMKEKREREESQ
jgi:hypothetical protein